MDILLLCGEIKVVRLLMRISEFRKRNINWKRKTRSTEKKKNKKEKFYKKICKYNVSFIYKIYKYIRYIYLLKRKDYYIHRERVCVYIHTEVIYYYLQGIR